MDAAEELKVWFRWYNQTLRMEYGNAMNLYGFSPEVVMAVQQEVARNMLGHLDLQLWDDELRA